MDNYRWQTWLLAGLLAWGVLERATGAETNTVAEAGPKPPTNSLADADLQLRASLRLQEQLHAAMLAIEQNRVEASMESRTNAELLAARLEFLEKSLTQERERQWQTSRDSNRITLLLAASVVGIGLLALAFTALFQSRGMNRLAEIATGFAHERTMLGLPPALGHGERLLIASDAPSGAQAALAATINRLERRILELENTPSLTPSVAENGSAISTGRSLPDRDHGADRRPPDRVAVLLGKGQVLLNLGQPENALACFDEAILAAPNRAETHVRKGMALERLKRLDEALSCYDRAIALNRSLTQAYLCKGGVFNQQERYAEALECYEQALRSEAKA
jgi:tetratricopeptide (TPR) repeat protein